jgi:ribosomal protein S18 acetylase RimI-like enzyme
MINVEFEKAISTDALRISVLLKTVYIQTYALDGITFEFANFIAKRFSTAYIENIICQDQDRLLIAYNNSNPIGVAELIYDSHCPIRKIQIPELSKLYVLERFYGKGIGSGLLQKTELILTGKGYKELSLEVWLENNRAIAFYKKHGFEIIGETDFPMETNTYRNYVMAKKL